MNRNQLISLLNKLANPTMTLLLRSPLHGLASRNLMLITYQGRRSGKIYTTPVNYVRDGDTILVVSSADRTWWRNLRGGAHITARVQGRDFRAGARCNEDPGLVVEGLLVLLQRSPAYCKRADITLGTDGRPERSDNLPRLAQGKVIVRITELVDEMAPIT